MGGVIKFDDQAEGESLFQPNSTQADEGRHPSGLANQASLAGFAEM